MMQESNMKNRCPAPSVSAFFSHKEAIDRIIGMFLFALFSPLIGFLILLVKLLSPGPGLYKQTRLGKNGKPFSMYKIRSMRQDAESRSGAVWASQKDPRVTRLGNVLRKLHLDELPQLINVAKGEMSLVGPRPERPEFVNILKEEIDGYEHRLLVKPGVTGYAQLNLPSDTEIMDVRRKLVLDFEYIESASLLFDIMLLIGTGFRFTRFIGVFPLSFLGIHRLPEESKWAIPLNAMPQEDRSMDLVEQAATTGVFG